MTRSVRTLMTGIIDYAGLFPPARLGMQEAVENYARYRRGEHAWMLGRFVCPVARLEEFSAAAAALMPGTYARSGYREMPEEDPWLVAALVEGSVRDALAPIDRFNERHAEHDHGRAAVDTVEIKADRPGVIDESLEALPEDFMPFFEIPLDADCRGLVAALADTGAAAKIRTGGLRPEAIPTVGQLVAFLHAAAAADVPFKATAGLHHPVRHVDPRLGPTHGFFNLFVAASMLRILGLEERTTASILEDELPTNFRFTEDEVAWRQLAIDSMQLAQVRERFALSFGSCSFDEPVEDLKQLRLL